MNGFRSLFGRLSLADSVPEANGGAHKDSRLRQKVNSLLHKGGGVLAHALTEKDLFTPTTVEVDGEDCLHDCESCSTKYPAKFNVEQGKHLYGHIKAWDRHILVATGKSDWAHKIHTEKGSLCEAIDASMDSINGGRTMLSASNIVIPDTSSSAPSGATRILLLPSFIFVDNVAPSNFMNLVPYINSTPINSAAIAPPASTQKVDSLFKVINCPHNYIVLLCSHKTRDARCGQSAPLIKKELERHLRPCGLLRDLHDDRPGGVGIYFVSHVGGHKFAANVLIYRRKGMPGTGLENSTKGLKNGNGHGELAQEEANGDADAMEQTGEEAAQCIWLARVKPEDCENIVRYTILEGKVVKPDTQLRGGFDRCKQLASW